MRSAHRVFSIQSVDLSFSRHVHSLDIFKHPLGRMEKAEALCDFGILIRGSYALLVKPTRKQLLAGTLSVQVAGLRSGMAPFSSTASSSSKLFSCLSI